MAAVCMYAHVGMLGCVSRWRSSGVVYVLVLGWLGEGAFGCEARSSPSRDLGRTGIDQCRSVRAFLLAADWKTLAEIRNDALRSSLIR
jgi:hypothetical protein